MCSRRYWDFRRKTGSKEQGLKIRYALAMGIWAALPLVSPHSTAQATATGLEISPVNVDFGESTIDSNGPARTVTISNPTTAPITLNQILTSGIDFSQKNNCGQTLAPGTQCAVQVSFSPAISGPRIGNLQITGSDGAPHFVALNGTGKNQ